MLFYNNDNCINNNNFNEFNSSIQYYLSSRMIIILNQVELVFCDSSIETRLDMNVFELTRRTIKRNDNPFTPI